MLYQIIVVFLNFFSPTSPIEFWESKIRFIPIILQTILFAGYNRVPVVEFLLEHGAEVHTSDKGGLVPLHNACSYGCL